MNQDEQPGENIFIMPDSLKKSDLVTVFTDILPVDFSPPT